MSAEDDGRTPLSPWLHDLAISVKGNVTALSAPGGDLGAMVGGPAGGRCVAAGVQGVYADDRRVVSVFLVRLGDETPVSVAAASSGGRSEFFGCARHLGNPRTDPTVEVRRTRTVTVQGVTEVIDVVSRVDEGIETDLVLHVGGDGALISAVRSGLVMGDVLAATLPDPRSDAGLSWRDEWHRTEVTFEPAPTSMTVGGRGEVSVATFRMVIAAGQKSSVVVTVRAKRQKESGFDADSGFAAVDWSAVSVQGTDRRLGPTLTAGLDDLQHLLLTDPQEPSAIFPAAGTPWYLTLFGRDSLWAARMMLPFGTELASGTLRALARRQGRVFDADSAQAPGKIPHEVRRTTYVDPTEGLDLPPVYYGTIDATPLWVTLLRDAWRWGLDDREVESLIPSLRAATRWLTELAAPDSDGLLRYIDTSGKGLTNQGWKDSTDAIRWQDGQVAQAPIALCEAQAYAIEAAAAAGELFAYFNLDGSADLSDYAAALRGRFRDHFWVGPPGEQYLALAVDGQGRAVDALGSNMGHVLGTGTLATEEVDRVARTLTSSALLGRYGICTLATDTIGYNPIGYHTGSIWAHDTAICAWGLAREGRRDEATRVAQSLLAAAEAFDYRFPELYGGPGAAVGVLDRPIPHPASCRPQAWSAASCAVLISVALGFEPDAPARRLTLRPARPAAYGQMSVTGLRFAGHSFGVSCAADGSTELLDAPDDVEIVIL